MINLFWKKVCDDKGVTPSWEYEACKQDVEEVERKISNSKQYIAELQEHQAKSAKALGSKNLVCLRTKNNMERHQQQLKKLLEEKQVLTKKIENMKLDFGE